jgi:hypothetical protein
MDIFFGIPHHSLSFFIIPYHSFSLFLGRDGKQHLGKLPDIDPGKQCPFAITGSAAAEQRVIPPCKSEDLAGGKDAFTPTGITGGLDGYFVHSASLNKKSRLIGRVDRMPSLLNFSAEDTLPSG